MIHHDDDNAVRNIYRGKLSLQKYLGMQKDIREIETFLKIREDAQGLKTDFKVFQGSVNLTLQGEGGKLNSCYYLDATIFNYIESNFKEFSMVVYKKLLADYEALKPSALKELQELSTEVRGLIV